jgi:hypothetical protein
LIAKVNKTIGLGRLISDPKTEIVKEIVKRRS